MVAIPISRSIAIDSDELEESFTRASGPGGQHVNTTDSAVMLRFDVARSPGLPDAVKHRLAAIAGTRMTREGVLVLRSEGARSQLLNRQEVRDRLIAMIREAKRMATSGRPLVIFPEGTRVPHGERRRLQAGFAGLYKALGLTVIPVAVDSGALYHRGLKLPGRITYRFGEPIPPGLDRADVEARVLDAINALNS